MSAADPSGSDNEAYCGEPAVSPARKRDALLKAQVADVDLREGDERGVIFFGEVDERKLLDKALQRAWDAVMAAGCDHIDRIEFYECAERSKFTRAEQKAFAGLEAAFTREGTRVALGYAEYSYVNFLGTKKISHSSAAGIAAVGATSGPAGRGATGASTGSQFQGSRKRGSIALTAFHRDLLDYQNLVELMTEESEVRLDLVGAYWEGVVEFSIAARAPAM